MDINLQDATRLDVNKEKLPLADDATKFIGSVKLMNGGHLFIERGDAQDYAQMRASQLSGLLTFISGAGAESFHLYGTETKDNVLWIAAGLADELKGLVQLVADDKLERK